MQCPNCGKNNDDSFRFCMQCGSPLPPAATEVRKPIAPPQPAEDKPAVRPVSQTPPSPPREYQRRPAYPTPQSAHPAYGGYSPPKAIVMPDLSALNIWGPFAGFGNRRVHTGWLMDGQGSRAQDLVEKVDVKFREREIPQVAVNHEILTARGLIVENRPYFILRRGLVSLALNITRFGRDLFISMAAYLKPPISNFRVLVVILMLLFQTYMTFIYPITVSKALDNMASGFDLFGSRMPDMSGLLSLLCFVGPLGAINGLLLFLLLCFSVYKWLTEKDFLAALRVSPNEFNEDDLMAMQKAVEQTVRISLDEIGLNPDDLKPVGGQAGRRLI